MEIARLFSESDKLNGADNYTAWSFKVETMLRGDEVYDEVVAKAPPTTIPTGEELKLWTKQKVQAMSIFQVTVKNHLIPTVCEFRDDPHNLWEHFQRWFESKAVQRKLILTRKLLNIRMLDSMSVDQYIQTIDKIRNELAAIGHKTNELDLIHNVLGGLPTSWGPFVSTSASKLTDATPPPYGNLIEQLHSEEYWHRNQRDDQLHEEALYADRSRTNFRGRSYGNRSRCYGGRNYFHRPFSFNQGGNSPFYSTCDQGNFRDGYSSYYNRGHNRRYNPPPVSDPNRDLKSLDAQIAQLQIQRSNLRNSHNANYAASDLSFDNLRASPPPSELAAELNFAGVGPSYHDWYVDSGSTGHITGDQRSLSNVAPSTSSSSIITASGSSLHVAAQGTLTLDKNEAI